MMGLGTGWIQPRWARPVAYAALVELISIAGTLLGPPQRPFARAVDLVAVVLIVTAAATVAFATRWPIASFATALAITGAYYGLGYHTDSPFFLGLVVTGYLTCGAGTRIRTAVFALGTFTVFGLLGLFGHSLDRSASLALTAIVAAGLIVGQVVSEARAELGRRETKQLKEDTDRRMAEERLRIARELHDVVSHSIAMINVQASTALHVLNDRPEQASEALRNIKDASHSALRDMRGILGLLRDAETLESRSPNGSIAQVASLVDNVRRSGAEITLTVECELSTIPRPIDLAAYRVVQEALTNVIRHAPGAPAKGEHCMRCKLGADRGRGRWQRRAIRA